MSAPELRPVVGPGDHVQGDDHALVTLVEYGDFECPYCGAAFPILKRVKKRMGKRLRFVFRQFPLSEIHDHAEHAAEAAEAVAARGGSVEFWTMHDLLFAHQHSLTDQDLAQYAVKASVDGEGVLDDLREGKYTEIVRASFMNGVRSGVNGTPTLFINGFRYDGQRDEESLIEVLTLVANEAEKSPKTTHGPR